MPFFSRKRALPRPDEDRRLVVLPEPAQRRQVHVVLVVVR